MTELQIDWVITSAVAVSGMLVYVAIAGFTYAVSPDHWKSSYGTDALAPWAASVWPFTLVCWIIYQTAMLGPNYVKRRKQAKRIPRAEVRQ